MTQWNAITLEALLACIKGPNKDRSLNQELANTITRSTDSKNGNGL